MFAAMLTFCCTHCPLSLSWYQCFVPPKFRLPHYSLAMCQCSHALLGNNSTILLLVAYFAAQWVFLQLEG